MQREVYPLITRLRNLDFWSWCRYFIDLSRDCPYGCCYCNTQKKSGFKGLHLIHGLPEEKETIGLGLISDVYSPDVHQNHSLQSILDFLFNEGYSIHIMTKSVTILNHLGILKKFAERDRVRITFTVLTLHETLSNQLEGLSPGPYERLLTLEKLRSKGIPAGVTISPLIPRINDDEGSLTKVIQECKNRDACWVLFSGFSVVSSFMEDSLWKKTGEVHSDPDRLAEHYKKVKKLVLKLLIQEGLPIRIPRITLDVFKRRHYTQVVGEYLFNISYLYELYENELKMLQYRRAAYEIENITGALKTIASSKKLGYIKGINPEIERVIEEILYTGKSTLYTTLYDNLVDGTGEHTAGEHMIDSCYVVH